MTHRYIKLGVTSLVLAGAFAALLWTTLRDGAEYFKTVDEVMVDGQARDGGKPLQLKGYVVPGSILVKASTLEYRFKVQNNPARSSEPGHVVDASYTGIVPDTFKDEAEVVLHGRFAAGGFKSDQVVAKCPSKYEAASKTTLAGS